MHRRTSILSAWALLAACHDVTLTPQPGQDDTGHAVLPDAPETTAFERSGGFGSDADGAAVLGAYLKDAKNAQEPPSSRRDSPAWEAFYDPDAVHTVDITLPEESWDALEDDGRVWVPGEVVIDDVVFPNAGVRRKGNTTWRSMSDKPSLKIKLRAFGEGPRLAGLKRITLNNMVTDEAQARENISLRLWAALGVEASRASWAVVTINGEPYGLYSNIESLDDRWIERRYENPGGNLWEANDDADFTEDGLPWWELAEGAGDTTTLMGLAGALETEEGTFEERVGGLVNTEQFLRYWAACLATGGTDGYPFKLNDVFVYGDPGNGGRLEFTPWSMDEAWPDTLSPWTAGALADACMNDAACDARRVAILDEVLADLDAIDVAALVQQSYATSDAFMADDPRKPFTSASVSAARAALAARIAGWPAQVRSSAR